MGRAVSQCTARPTPPLPGPDEHEVAARVSRRRVRPRPPAQIGTTVRPAPGTLHARSRRRAPPSSSYAITPHPLGGLPVV
jgi:hypothetical protein